MKHLILVISLLLAGISSHAQSSCQPSVQGIGDVFPWSEPQPFPWSKIQGLWKVEGDNDTVIKFRTIRQTGTIKQLEVEFYEKSESCIVPVMKGKGFVSSFEKDIVRMSADGKVFKFAMFSTAQLKMDPLLCGNEVMVANILDLNSEFIDEQTEEYKYDNTNLMLKKLTSSLDLYCKKRN